MKKAYLYLIPIAGPRAVTRSQMTGKTARLFIVFEPAIGITFKAEGGSHFDHS